MGLSFSVPPGKAVPSSLQNIYKELQEDCACTKPKHGDLEKVHTAAIFEQLSARQLFINAKFSFVQ